MQGSFVFLVHLRVHSIFLASSCTVSPRMKLSLKERGAEFVTFIREQGVMGLAIGFILGGSVSKVVASLVQDIIQPVIGLIFGSTQGLKAFHLGPVLIGNFLAIFIDFLIMASVVYFVFKKLKLDRIDKKKE
jgi:large conductance mechanosensitive channel